MVFEVAPDQDRSENRQPEHQPAYGSGDAVDARAKQVAAQSENCGPDDGTQSVEDKKSPGRQSICAGKNCCKRAEQSDEAAKEDDRAAVAGEQIPPELSFSGVEPDKGFCLAAGIDALGR